MKLNEISKQEVLKIYDYVLREEVSASDALCLICDLAEDVYCDVMEPYFEEEDEEYSLLVGNLCANYENFHGTAKSYLRDLEDGEEPAELRRWVMLARED